MVGRSRGRPAGGGATDAGGGAMIGDTKKAADARRERADRAAEEILERVMKRKNWNAETRDNLAVAIVAVVAKELAIFKVGGQ